MSEIFISYARSTARQAQQVALALRSLGYGVWLDDDIPAHRSFAEVIEERLEAAKAVVVIWSPDATRSEWVRSEASRAREAGKLVQLIVEKTPLPMPFDQFECANLATWNGDPAAPGWRKVVASIGHLVGEARESGTQERPRGRAAGLSPKATQPVLAVLAFDNLSGDPDMVWFSDGVSEEIQQTVSRGAGLKVVGRTSSFQLRGADKDIRRVAGELGATHILDGSVRRSGGTVRIAAQLIECAGQTTLWSDRFDRDLSDVFALQDEIAAAVAAALQIAFTPPASPFAFDPSVHDLFLRAQTRLEYVDLDKTVETLGMLEEVVALAPDFARAWALLAFGRAVTLRVDSQAAARLGVTAAGAREAADVALRLDDRGGVTYLALSFLEPFGHYAEREALVRTALEADPNHPPALVTMALLYFEVGRHAEATDYARRAYDLDALSPHVADAYGVMLTYGPPSTEKNRQIRELWKSFRLRWPDHDGIAYDAIGAAIVGGDWETYDALIESLRPKISSSRAFRGLMWTARNLRNPDPVALANALERIRGALERSGVLALDALFSLSRLGMTQEVFELVDQASFAHLFDALGSTSGIVTPGIIFTAENRAMSGDIRFVGLCAKLGLCAYWLKSDRWPDCAEPGVLPYDFKAECRRLAAT